MSRPKCSDALIEVLTRMEDLWLDPVPGIHNGEELVTLSLKDAQRLLTLIEPRRSPTGSSS